MFVLVRGVVADNDIIKRKRTARNVLLSHCASDLQQPVYPPTSTGDPR